MTLEFEFDDCLFEVDTKKFDPGRPARRWGEEGDPGEIELTNEVVMIPTTDEPLSRRKRHRISMDDFLVKYADWKEIPVIEAYDDLLEECFRMATRRVEDDFDDRNI